jgi:hypothetical protein
MFDGVRSLRDGWIRLWPDRPIWIGVYAASGWLSFARDLSARTIKFDVPKPGGYLQANGTDRCLLDSCGHISERPPLVT